MFSKDINKDVKHMFVKYDGLTNECFIDSIDEEYLYFIPKDSVDKDSILLNDIYYAYNDFGRFFFMSWSFEENLRRIQNTTGTVYLIDGDSINYINIQFNKDMINPEVFIKTGGQTSNYISLFSIKNIKTDFSILNYSVKRGFYYSYYPFIMMTTLDLFLKWDSKRRIAPQVWDNYNDLFPSIATIGLQKTGVSYQSFTSVIPVSVLFSMIYDFIKEKNVFHFAPIFREQKFKRNMKIFSLKQLFKNQLKNIIFKVRK
jgi:hypothetical protein